MNKKNFSTIVSVFLVFLFALQAVHATELAYLTNITSTNFLPSIIRAGDVVSMAVNVQNRGTSFSIVDWNGTIDLGNQFDGITTVSNIAKIDSGATQTLVFSFRAKTNALPGYYSVLLTMNYLRNSEPVKETYNILVPISKVEKNIDVTVSPKVINPGNQTNLVFSLQNISGAPISNISFSWDEKSDLILPVGSDNKRYVSLLDSNNTEKLSFVVAADPNITPGIYPLDVNLSFTDINGIKNQQSQVGIIVGGTTDFEISAETLSTGQLSISIANVGSNNASAVVVKIPQQAGFRVQGSNIAILGNLNKGDYTLATFQSQSADRNNTTSRQGFPNTRNQSQGNSSTQNNFRDQNFAGANAFSGTLTIQIDYTDTTGERQTVQKKIELSSNSTSNVFSGFSGRTNNRDSTLQLALLAIIAIAGIVFNKLKAKKDWKELGIVIAITIVLFLIVIFLLNSDAIATAIVTIVSIGLLVMFYRNGLPEQLKKVFQKSKR